ncbi:MAG: hypothetical protein QXU20_03785 [Candidatus Woesearchaeota archaeon]
MKTIREVFVKTLIKYPNTTKTLREWVTLLNEEFSSKNWRGTTHGKKPFTTRIVGNLMHEYKIQKKIIKKTIYYTNNFQSRRLPNGELFREVQTIFIEEN